MSPRITFLVTLVGVLIAGLPLPWLTRVAETSTSSAALQSAAGEESVYATLRCTGNPERVVLRCGGQVLADVAGALPWEGELKLPMQAGLLEIEIEADWSGAGEQAATLTLEPTSRSALSCTRWADSGRMHDIFTFTW